MRRVKQFFARLAVSRSSGSGEPAPAPGPRVLSSASSVALAPLTTSRAPDSVAVTEHRNHVYLSERRAHSALSALSRCATHLADVDASPRAPTVSRHPGPVSTPFPPLARPSGTVHPPPPTCAHGGKCPLPVIDRPHQHDTAHMQLDADREQSVQTSAPMQIPHGRRDADQRGNARKSDGERRDKPHDSGPRTGSTSGGDGGGGGSDYHRVGHVAMRVSERRDSVWSREAASDGGGDGASDGCGSDSDDGGPCSRDSDSKRRVTPSSRSDDGVDGFIHWEIQRVLQLLYLQRRYVAHRVREPLWVDVCVLHRRCARILSGVVIHEACVRGVDCRAHYHLVDYNDDLTFALTWRDVARYRQQELAQLETVKPRGTSLLQHQRQVSHI